MTFTAKGKYSKTENVKLKTVQQFLQTKLSEATNLEVEVINSYQ